MYDFSSFKVFREIEPFKKKQHVYFTLLFPQGNNL